jgi:hypothetical protein
VLAVIILGFFIFELPMLIDMLKWFAKNCFFCYNLLMCGALC